MKSLKKYARPIILAVQTVATVGTVVSILCKKNTLAGIFAATGLAATAAMWLFNKKECAENKAEEDWDSEKFLEGLFEDEDFLDGLDEVEEKSDEEISVSVEEELLKDMGDADVSEDELSQAIVNLEEAGKALKEALDEFDGDSEDTPTI